MRLGAEDNKASKVKREQNKEKNGIGRYGNSYTK